MQLRLAPIFCVFAAVLGFALKDATAATTVRPYEFGFRLNDFSQQHRSEKRDERGIVMGEFGFITADGIYHVTVYATDEDGKFRILAMRNFPYEAKPKIIDMVVASKPKPTAIAAPSPTAAPKKQLPGFNFSQTACSGCFLTNNVPKETPAVTAVKKTDIRTLAASLPPSPPESSITGTGTGKVLVGQTLPKVLNKLQNIAQTVQSPIRPTIEDTVSIAKLTRGNSKTPNTQPKQTPTTYSHTTPQTAAPPFSVPKDNLGKAQVRLTDVTNKKPNLVKDNLGQPSNNVANFGKIDLTAQRNVVTDNLGQPQRRLTTVPNAVTAQPNLTKNRLVKDNIGNPQRRLTAINTNVPAAARITTGNSRRPVATAAFGQATTLNKKALTPLTHSTTPHATLAISPDTNPKEFNLNSNKTPVVTARKNAAPANKFNSPINTPITNTAKTQPGSAGTIDLRVGDSSPSNFNPKAPSQFNVPSGVPTVTNTNPSAKKPAASTFAQANGAPKGGGSSFSGALGKPSAAGDAGDLYRFKYTLDYNGHEEKGSRNGYKEGSFFSIGDDNVERTIEYIANEFGYQPRIRWRKLDTPVKPKENTLKDYEFVWFKE